MVNAGGRDGEPFARVTQEAWAARVEREVKTTPEKLRTRLEDGRVMRALYTEVDVPSPSGAPGLPPFVRGGHAPGVRSSQVWCRVTGRDLAVANRALLEDLAGGASGLEVLRFGPEAPPLDSEADLEKLLAGVRLDAITLAFEPSPSVRSVADSLARWVKDPTSAQLHFGFDPLAAVASFGGAPELLASLYDDAAWAMRELVPSFPRSRVLTASTVPYHEAGASPDFELACLLGSLVATLRALEARGVLPEIAARQLSLTLPLDADFLLGIVKLRAARAVVYRLLSAAGVPDELAAPPVYACSSRRMLTAFEPFTNTLRTGAAAFAALAGGADFVEVAPHDERSTPSAAAGREAARRLARNTAHVLMEEAHAAKVEDPAGGAYFFEAETLALAQSAWANFRAMESEGGFEALLYRGQIAMVTEANYFEQERRIQLRERALTGITEFAELGTAGPSALAEVPPPPAPGLRRRHTALPFERLRAASEVFRARTGHLPEVQLLTLGPRSEHDARRAWVTNLLAAGGLVATSEERPVAVVCGADLRYETEAAPLAQSLKSSGRVRHLSLAGKPKHEPMLRLAGVDEFIFLGEDVVRFLAALQGALGVSS